MKEMKKISLRGISEILSEKELKNVMGGSYGCDGKSGCKNKSDCASNQICIQCYADGTSHCA